MDSKKDKQIILVVDDAPLNIALLSNILSSSYKVKVATNGKKAIQIANTEPRPDLLLLDIMMPGMSGYEVCEKLKQDPATASIPVIFITAKTTEEDERHGFELGAVDYIAKPISPVIVEARVKTQLSLKKNMEDLRKAYAIIETQKDRMQQELDVGRNIQLAMVPKDFPVSHDYSIFATLEPAREVGGDFYDAFVVDEEHICFCVGDVSGKGVPAALFMAMAKTLIKARASSDPSTASIVTHVNDEMSKDNEGCLFVTLFVCILNIRTGELLTTNAGHNPPLLKHVDGTITTLSHRDGLVVAAMDGIAYSEQHVQLQKGDTLLLYTDGVTEADNLNEEFFGDDRLKRLLADWQDGPMEKLVEHIIETTHTFEGENRQADDITVLALHYFGKKADDEHSFDIEIGNELTNIDRVIEKFMEFSSANGISGKITNPICMAFDELLTNIISYAYVDGASHEIGIKVSLIQDAVVIVITDDGLPFNPFTREDPDTDLSIEERGIGGLGIHLVKNVMDEAYYKRHVDRNVITIVKNIEQAK
jgi:serine phosphatase RsbU (regulator of sigma subunit)/anti-sigma regulatory factor (Ser/Thr protein kinase)